jgi:hypothetical protein
MGWSFTTHKDLLLHINYTPAASFLVPSPSSKELLDPPDLGSTMAADRDVFLEK